MWDYAFKPLVRYFPEKNLKNNVIPLKHKYLYLKNIFTQKMNH